MTDAHTSALAYLSQLEQESRERYRPQQKPPEAQPAISPTVSIPAVGAQFARSEVEAAHGMVAAIGQVVADAKVRAREVMSEYQGAKAEVERLGEERVEAFAAGDEALADGLQSERAKGGGDGPGLPGAASGR